MVFGAIPCGRCAPLTVLHLWFWPVWKSQAKNLLLKLPIFLASIFFSLLSKLLQHVHSFTLSFLICPIFFLAPLLHIFSPYYALNMFFEISPLLNLQKNRMVTSWPLCQVTSLCHSNDAVQRKLETSFQPWLYHLQLTVRPRTSYKISEDCQRLNTVTVHETYSQWPPISPWNLFFIRFCSADLLFIITFASLSSSCHPTIGLSQDYWCSQDTSSTYICWAHPFQDYSS